MSSAANSVFDERVVNGNLSNHTAPKKWTVVALFVGTFAVVVIGGFGIAGLLHQYGVVSLPSWFANVVSVVGNTPNFWSLWVIAVGGVVGGSALVAIAACKRTSKKECILPVELKPVVKPRQISMELFKADPVAPLTEEIYEKVRNQLKIEQYTCVALPSENSKLLWVVIQINNIGLPLCTQALTEDERDQLINLEELKNFRRVEVELKLECSAHRKEEALS